MLLIASNESDLATDYLILRLQERGVPYFRFNTDRLGTDYNATIEFRSQIPQFVIERSNGENLRSSDVTGALLRDPRLPSTQVNAEPERLWVEAETAEFLRSLWRLVPDGRWLNCPSAVHRASNKIEQLARAASLGGTVPETRIGVPPTAPGDLLDAPEKTAIIKAVRAGFIETPSELWFAPTRKIGHEDLAGIQSSAWVPCTYQQLVPKRSDVRVTIVGDRVFATEIFSQEHEETAIDWRTWDFSSIALRHERIDLPPDVSATCLKLTHAFGLQYSAIDLIRRPDDVYIFLELNPTGQWAWIEQMVGYPIRDEMINLLRRAR